MKKHLIEWSKEPIIVPRWLLTLKYIAFVVLGTLSVIGGIPSITVATFETFTTVWSAGLVVSAVIAGVASVRREWEDTEKWASLAITAFLLTWSVAAIWRAVTEGDIDRAAGAFAVLVITFLPGARAFGLLRNTGLK